MTSSAAHNEQGRSVGLFITCTADLFRPSVGFAAIKLLEEAGCSVDVPPSQTCCAQPAYNAGDMPTARDLAKQVIEAFEGFDYIVAPSGSCADMLRNQYAPLLNVEGDWADRAKAFSQKCHELISFLTDVCGVTQVDQKLDAVVTYHDSCSSNRGMNVKSQPRVLLETIEGLTLKELEDTEACCGFGGLFSVKYDDISNRIVTKKAEDVAGTEATMLVGGDLGCLLNIAGKLSRQGRAIEVRHVAEVLAGMTDTDAIGATKTR